MFDPSMYHRLGEKLHEVYSHGVTRTTSLTNPYTPQLALLQDELYRDPTPGFQTRIIILFIINGLVVLLGMVYLTLLIIDVKRKGVSSTNWCRRSCARCIHAAGASILCAE